MKKFLLPTLLVFFSAPLIAQDEAAEPPATLVEIQAVKSEQIAEQIWVPGTVVSRTDSNIASEVAGRITWMAEVGDLVEAGDVLAKLDDQMLQLNYAQNTANIATWLARVDLLERKQKRFTAMAAQQNSSKDQLDEVLSDLEIARQELAQAQISRKLTAHQISQSEVKAPFKSLVAQRRQSPGEYTSIGQDLIRIVDTSNIEASIRAPLSVVPFIHKGGNVQVKSKQLERTQNIRAIVPVGNARSRMMEVRVELNSGDFAIGSAVRVALPHSEYHTATIVPRDALVLRKSGAFIYQIDSEDMAQQVAVKTGIGAGDHIEVFGEIDILSPVVVRGAERLKTGQKVRYETNDEQLAKII